MAIVVDTCNTKILAKRLRQEYKSELGLNRTHISVQSDLYSVRVYIKTVEAEEHKNTIRDLAMQCESIDRCDVTGEIMGGGNTFVFVYDIAGRGMPKF